MQALDTFAINFGVKGCADAEKANCGLATHV